MNSIAHNREPCLPTFPRWDDKLSGSMIQHCFLCHPSHHTGKANLGAISYKSDVMYFCLIWTGNFEGQLSFLCKNISSTAVFSLVPVSIKKSLAHLFASQRGQLMKCMFSWVIICSYCFLMSCHLFFKVLHCFSFYLYFFTIYIFYFHVSYTS